MTIVPDPTLDRVTEVVRMMVVITQHGNWPAVDFIDEREVLRDGGPALLGVGEGEGASRAIDAARRAIRDLDDQIRTSPNAPTAAGTQ